MNHPNEFVSPKTWKELSIGTVTNVRQGTGIEDDMLIADLLITDFKAIEHVNKNLPELSCGYDSEYEQTEPGHAVQRNIIGNHVALVDRGRAGPRVAIKDSQSTNVELIEMAKRKSFAGQFLRIMTAFKSNDSAALERELTTLDAAADPDDDTTNVMDKEMRDALDWIAGQRKAAADAAAKAAQDKAVKDAFEAKEKEEKEEEEKKKAKDALLTAEPAPAAPDLGVLHTGDGLKTVLGRAEILFPGVTMPTTDSIKSRDHVGTFMLGVVQKAYATEPGKAAIEPFLMGQKIEAVTKDNVFGVFNGASELRRQQNNSKSNPGKLTTKDFGRPPPSASELNEVNKKFWTARS
jgi:hypothetical protein